MSHEFYAWLGNKIYPLVSENLLSVQEMISIKLKFLSHTQKAVYAETKAHKKGWFPKSQLNVVHDSIGNRIGIWENIKINRWFYKKNEHLFGIL